MLVFTGGNLSRQSSADASSEASGRGWKRRIVNSLARTESYATAVTYEEDEKTRIMGCATMWHETSDEMIEMIKSIFRIDEDYSAR